jgi:hypothetical protein
MEKWLKYHWDFEAMSLNIEEIDPRQLSLIWIRALLFWRKTCLISHPFLKAQQSKNIGRAV